MRRIALVVHPTRPVDRAMETIADWTARNQVGLIQLPVEVGERRVCEPGELEAGDVVVALGGDGTALSALRAAAAVDSPVLAVACGSLGALSTISADGLAEALDRVQAGDWSARPLPALEIEASEGPDDWALNDFVVVRRGSGQIVVDLAVNGELYVRLAGDGLIVATPVGSSGYTLAAGGPVLGAHTPAFVCTPLAMHGGTAAPLVVEADAVLTVGVRRSYAGFYVEIDGHRRGSEAHSFELTLRENKARLVSFSPSDNGLTRLRQHGLIADSPRVLVRDRREAG